MPDPYSIPFKQAAGNGHYESKQLPDDRDDFLVGLDLPPDIGNVNSIGTSLDKQITVYNGTTGTEIRAATDTGLAKLAGGVLSAVAAPTGAVVGTTDVQTLTNKTITGSSITAPIGLTKADVGLGNVDNTSDVNKPISTLTQNALNNKEDRANKGIVNGYPALDTQGKVPIDQLPPSVIGASRFMGTWNAATNVPAIPAASVSNQGWYFTVAVAGSTSIDGISSWAVGDTIISNGSIWQKIPVANAVQSVNGKTGIVVVNKNDVLLGNVDNTSDATKNAAAVTLTNKTIDGTNNTLNVRLNTSDVSGNLPTNKLNGGTGASATTFWRGDGQWVAPAGAGDVQGPASSADGEVTLFSGTTGKQLKSATGTGFVQVTNGVYQTPQQLSKLVVGDTAQGTHPASAVIVPRFANHADRVFSTTTAFDDHFEGSSVNAKWTYTNSLAAPVFTAAGSKMILGGYSPNGADGVNYKGNVWGALPNTNNFEVVVRWEPVVVALSPYNNSIGTADIQLYNLSSNVGVTLQYFMFQPVAANNLSTSGMNLLAGTNATATTVISTRPNKAPNYIRMMYTASTFVVAVSLSEDGIGWAPLISVTAGQSGFGASVLPQRLYMGLAGTNGGGGFVHIDWVKFTNV